MKGFKGPRRAELKRNTLQRPGEVAKYLYNAAICSLCFRTRRRFPPLCSTTDRISKTRSGVPRIM